MSDGLTDLLASIDDVLQDGAAPASAPVATPVPVPAPVERRSTVTEVVYEPVGPAISRTLHSSVRPRPQPVPAGAVEPVPAVEGPVPAEPVETVVEEVEEEAEAGAWWQKKPPAETETETSVEAAVAAAVAAVAAGVAAGAAAETAETATVAGEPNPRWRWLLYNGGAAAAGHLVIWSLAGDPMAGAHYMARMTVSVPQLAAAGLTVVAAYGGWRVAGLLRGLPGLLGLAVRPLGALVAAMWGVGSAPLVQTALDAIEPWGTLLSPLLAAGPLAVGCWYGLDRRAAHARLIRPVRWLARVPVATVVVSSLLYTPGALL